MYWFIQHITPLCWWVPGTKPEQVRGLLESVWLSSYPGLHLISCSSSVKLLILFVSWFLVLVSCLFKYSRTTHRWNELASKAFRATLGESSQCASAVITNNIRNSFGGGGGRSFCWFQFGSERRSGQAVILREAKQMWRKREVRVLWDSDWDPYSWSGTRLGGCGILQDIGVGTERKIWISQGWVSSGCDGKKKKERPWEPGTRQESGRWDRQKQMAGKRCTLPASAEDTRLSCNQN